MTRIVNQYQGTKKTSDLDEQEEFELDIDPKGHGKGVNNK
jgi:hypothetical protein